MLTSLSEAVSAIFMGKPSQERGANFEKEILAAFKQLEEKYPELKIVYHERHEGKWPEIVVKYNGKVILFECKDYNSNDNQLSKIDNNNVVKALRDKKLVKADELVMIISSSSKFRPQAHDVAVKENIHIVRSGDKESTVNKIEGFLKDKIMSGDPPVLFTKDGVPKKSCSAVLDGQIRFTLDGKINRNSAYVKNGIIKLDSDGNVDKDSPALIKFNKAIKRVDDIIENNPEPSKNTM